MDAGSRLSQEKIELARAEVQADFAAEVGTAKMLAGAAVGVFLGISVMLLAAIAALVLWVPNWLVATAFGLLFLALSGLLGYAGWKRRVGAPHQVTRTSLKKDVQWVKRKSRKTRTLKGRSGGSRLHEDRTPQPRALRCEPTRRRLSTRDLLSRVLHTASQLVSTEMALAREEGKANLEAEFATVESLVVAGRWGRKA